MNYICAHCGNNSIVYGNNHSIDTIDSGLIIECAHCKKETVFDLDTPEDRAQRYIDARLWREHSGR